MSVDTVCRAVMCGSRCRDGLPPVLSGFPPVREMGLVAQATKLVIFLSVLGLLQLWFSGLGENRRTLAFWQRVIRTEW